MKGPVPLHDWLRSRVPEPPRDLASRIAAMTAGTAGAPVAPHASALLDAGEAAMGTVLQGGCLTRQSALDLLAVDAIVTYAFEAAADDPDRLEERAAEALARIAALAAPYEA